MADSIPPIFLGTAIEAVIRAGDVQMAQFGRGVHIEKKGAIDLVTEIDREVERGFRATIAERFPDHGVLGEEFEAAGERLETPEYCWIFDPLDGTTNYAHGLPVFGVSIALEVAHRLLLGVVYDPTRDEMFVGERGGGATLNDAPIRVSATSSIGASLLVTGFPYNIRQTADTNLREYAAFSLKARAVRRLGSAVIDLAYVACGRFDGYWELSVAAWDVAAGAVLVDEAGGRITGVDGRPLDVDAPTLLATNGLIHDTMLATLEEIRRG